MHIRNLVFSLLSAAVGFVACKDDDNPIIPVLPSDAEIIAKNLRGEELEAKLGEAIEGKKGF